MPTYPRSSGILLHPTSLPGPYGIGTLNRAAYEFVDFLEQAGQKLWQVLPMGPTGYGDSPYQSYSSFAGNPYLVPLETLVRERLLDQERLDRDLPEMPEGKADYCQMYEWKLPLLLEVARDFERRATSAQKADYGHWCTQQSSWLEDFALFMAIKTAHHGKPWNEWEVPLRDRDSHALRAAAHHHQDLVDGHRFIQWLFFRSWEHIKRYANDKGIRVFGDIPIFVAMDSSDTWVHPHCFHLDQHKRPRVVAGVPPDYFAPDGQLWGNPLYRWREMKEDGFTWWLERIQAAFKLYDLVRIDHFRGFHAYWEVPGKAKVARKGRWVKAPGIDLFKTVKQKLGDLAIIAEDLGFITPEVIALRERYGFPGMKILQFGFGSDASDKFLPHNYEANFVAYTGTHDNDTSLGWYATAKPHEQDYFRRYLNSDGSDVPDAMIRGIMGSVATMAIAPLQDVLGLGTEARMNFPGRRHDNWQWRYKPGDVTEQHARRLRELAETYGR